MKKILCLTMIVMVMMCQMCLGAVVYPQSSDANVPEFSVEERINIVYDNSGHEYVKKMFMDIMTAVSFAENSEIWLYPIAGSVEPVKLEANQSFMSKNFVSYSKSSNEFKSENIMEKAIEDLNADSRFTQKRLIVYSDYDIKEIRSEYDPYGIGNYAKNNPDLTFTSFTSYGNSIESQYIYIVDDKNFSATNNLENYDGMRDKTLSEFLMVKYGYSECESQYDEVQGVLKIPQGQADTNIFVTATNTHGIMENGYNRTGVESAVYVGGCLMDSKGLEDYKSKKTVTGVALAYNYISTDAGYPEDRFVAALFTTDGVVLDALNEDLYVPLVNAYEAKVYYRSKKGAGVCSDTITYDTTHDKTVLNYNAPVEKEENSTVKEESVEKNGFTLGSKNQKEVPSAKKNILAVIFGIILSVIGTVLSVAFSILYLGVIAFIIAFIASSRFRGYVHLKIIGSKLEPVYEFISGKITAIGNDIKGAGIKIKGTVTAGEDFIFISKSSKDMQNNNNRVSLVVKELESRGVNCWLSENGIKPGEDYNEVLPQKISECTMMVFFVSVNSINSPEVESEIGTAKQNKKIIIPVQIEKFDLFTRFPKWAHMLKQYQKTELFKSNPDSVKAVADDIENMYRKLANK